MFKPFPWPFAARLRGPRERRLAFACALLLGAGRLGAETPILVQARAPLKLIRAPQIQAELGLDAQQVQALETGLERVDLPLWQMRDVPDEAAREPARGLSRQLRVEIERVLRPSQLARFDQLVLRSAAGQGLLLPLVVDQLQLEDPQQRRYAQFLTSVENLPDKSVQSLAFYESNWIQAELTPRQQRQLQQMMGKPFNFSRLTLREVKAPELRDVETWINSPPLALANLRGKVVLVEFWTFACINCIHNLPHYRNWYASLPRDRVVQIGIHTPETAAEHDLERVRQAVREKGLAYPIAVDNQRANWVAWGNNVWPSLYLVDKQGYVRYWWYGELNWQGATGDQQMLGKIYQLLAEPATPTLFSNRVPVAATAALLTH